MCPRLHPASRRHGSLTGRSAVPAPDHLARDGSEARLESGQGASLKTGAAREPEAKTCRPRAPPGLLTSSRYSPSWAATSTSQFLVRSRMGCKRWAKRASTSSMSGKGRAARGLQCRLLTASAAASARHRFWRHFAVPAQEVGELSAARPPVRYRGHAGREGGAIRGGRDGAGLGAGRDRERGGVTGGAGRERGAQDPGSAPARFVADMAGSRLAQQLFLQGVAAVFMFAFASLYTQIPGEGPRVGPPPGGSHPNARGAWRRPVAPPALPPFGTGVSARAGRGRGGRWFGGTKAYEVLFTQPSSSHRAWRQNRKGVGDRFLPRPSGTGEGSGLCWAGSVDP